MKRAAYLIDTSDPRHVVIKGALRQWLKDEGIPAQWAPAQRGWFLRRERVPDVTARLEHAGYSVRGMTR
ncbi:hypothetical protein [Terrabacter sp. BE26]|uniref:hypothetical protein n=1 Tax=Terrabacter sp. BE26 TaxID=2898152 RepID=UPI0035BE6B9C